MYHNKAMVWTDSVTVFGTKSSENAYDIKLRTKPIFVNYKMK